VKEELGNVSKEYGITFIPSVFEAYTGCLGRNVNTSEGVPYVKIYRYNPKHLYPKLNGYGDNGQRSLEL
jgi:hypothetical protein